MNLDRNAQARTWPGGNARTLIGAALLAALAMVMPAPAAAARTDAAAASRAATKDYHFNNIPVRSVLQLLADEGNFNLVVSDSVEGTISLHLDDVTWEQALAIVLRMKRLEQYGGGSLRSVTAR